MPVRFHDATISIVTCHLPANLSSGSVESKRNTALQELFGSGTASGERFDLNLQCHHTLLLGKWSLELPRTYDEPHTVLRTIW